MCFFGRKKTRHIAPAHTVVPEHIAIILDGNGRWAKKRGLPRTAGHAAGAETFRRIGTYCRDIGVKYLTAYAFSTENWRRSKDEVDAIWSLLYDYLRETLERMETERVKMKILGSREGMPERVRSLLEEIDRKAETIDGITLCLCINYGSRDEITHAVREICEECAAGTLEAKDVDADTVASHLYSAGIPDPDLVIRPSGEKRLSNFLMWQSAYSELYFCDTLWPDFKPEDIDLAVEEYGRRDRRYGGVKS